MKNVKTLGAVYIYTQVFYKINRRLHNINIMLFSNMLFCRMLKTC